MTKFNCGPITPHNIVSDPRYLSELEMRKPKPRIKAEDKWIKDFQEEGSIGLLFQLQHMDNRRREIEMYKQQRSKLQSRNVIPGCKSGRHVWSLSNKRQKENQENKADQVRADIAEKCEICEAERNALIANTEQSKISKSQKAPDQVNPTAKRAYLRAHSISGPPLNIDKYPPIKKIDTSSPRATQLTVTTAKSASSVHFERRNINYIRANAYALQSDRYKPQCRSASAGRQLDMHNYKKGEVPNYLLEMRKKTGTKIKSASTSHVSKERLLSAQEKRQLIDKLKSDLDNWFRELNKMPISMETLRSRSKKDAIEKQIDQINQHIEVFSKQNVYVEE